MPRDVGFREIRTLEQQRLSLRLAHRISHAVAEIQPRRVPPLAVTAERRSSMAVFVRAERHESNVEG